jgi:hypothetical protein
LTSFVAGISWSLGHPKGILLDIVCDSSADRDFVCALERLPSDLHRDMLARRAHQKHRVYVEGAQRKATLNRLVPLVRVHGAVRMCSSDPKQALPGYEDETEFVQLTDVLLGVLWDAIRARQLSERRQAGRIQLSSEWREESDEQVQLAWRSRLPLRRAVSVSMYPDEHGRAYPATVLKPLEKPGQQTFDFSSDVWASRKQRKHASHEGRLELK